MENARDYEYKEHNTLIPGTFLPRINTIITRPEIKCKNYRFCGESFTDW